MAFSENDMKKLLSLDDESFAKLIVSIAEATGGAEGAKKAQKLASDVPSLKKLMSRLTPEEAEGLIAKAGKNKTTDIYNIIKDSKNGR